MHHSNPCIINFFLHKIWGDLHFYEHLCLKYVTPVKAFQENWKILVFLDINEKTYLAAEEKKKSLQKAQE